MLIAVINSAPVFQFPLCVGIASGRTVLTLTLSLSLSLPNSVNILAFLGLVCCWLQPTRKLSENYQFFCIKLSGLGILLLLSTNEPVVVNSCHLYDAKLNLFIPFFMALYQTVCAPLHEGAMAFI